MHPLLTHIHHTDKRRFLIYLFSYGLYRYVNNAFSNAVLYLLNEESFRERWTANSVPCVDTPHAFLIAFQLFKILLFVLLVRFIKQKADSLITEVFVAYFIYDLVYILSFLWDLIPFPFHLDSTWWMLISSGQIFLNHYMPHLDLIFAVLWTMALLLVLKVRNRLSLLFLINRLAIIPISVPFIAWSVYLLLRLF